MFIQGIPSSQIVRTAARRNKGYEVDFANTESPIMFIQGIPSSQIVRTAARRNKDYEVDFANTESYNDVYTLKAFLRKNDTEYKAKLVLISSILAYPALNLTWRFDEDDYELASRVFHRVCDEVDDIKTHYERSMMPISTLAAQIREACKPISSSHQEKTNIPFIDEAAKLPGTADWRWSLYRGQYPKITRADKEQVQKLEGNHIEKVLRHRTYNTREKY